MLSVSYQLGNIHVLKKICIMSCIYRKIKIGLCIPQNLFPFQQKSIFMHGFLFLGHSYLDDSGPQCDHWPCPGDSFSLLKLSKTPSEAREKQVFESSAKNCQTPTPTAVAWLPLVEMTQVLFLQLLLQNLLFLPFDRSKRYCL